MSYYKQFAEMLGLKRGEEFILTDSDGKIDEFTYRISDDGIYYKTTETNIWSIGQSSTLRYLLNGTYKAVPKPWKPKRYERYWRYQPQNSGVSLSTWCDDGVDLCRWKVGNCFETEKEAKTKGKEIMEAIKKEYEEA